MQNKALKMLILLGFSSLMGLVFVSCQDNYTPKPSAYYRIALPTKSYYAFDSLGFPYRFKLPSYARFSPYEQKGEVFWGNVQFKSLNAQLYLSYKKIQKKDSLEDYIRSAHFFVDRHMPKATGVFEYPISIPKHHVYGTFFKIEGKDVATSYQFYISDSANNFVRAVLYFDNFPNNDSLAPVLDFVKIDLDTLINSFQWEDQNQIKGRK